MIRRPPRSTQSRSSAASDVYKRQGLGLVDGVGLLRTYDDGQRQRAQLVRKSGARGRHQLRAWLPAGPRIGRPCDCAGCGKRARIFLRTSTKPAGNAHATVLVSQVGLIMRTYVRAYVRTYVGCSNQCSCNWTANVRTPPSRPCHMRAPPSRSTTQSAQVSSEALIQLVG